MEAWTSWIGSERARVDPRARRRGAGGLAASEALVEGSRRRLSRALELWRELMKLVKNGKKKIRIKIPHGKSLF